jgi:hypothetical protein
MTFASITSEYAIEVPFWPIVMFVAFVLAAVFFLWPKRDSKPKIGKPKTKLKSRLFRFRLLTAVVMMIWLGAMQTLSKLGLNFNERPKIPSGATIQKWDEQGFPLRTYARVVYLHSGIASSIQESSRTNIIVDLLFWPCSTLAVAFVCEYLISRREGRTP